MSDSRRDETAETVTPTSWVDLAVSAFPGARHMTAEEAEAYQAMKRRRFTKREPEPLTLPPEVAALRKLQRDRAEAGEEPICSRCYCDPCDCQRYYRPPGKVTP